MAGGKIFINYRRDDSRADSGRLYDRLNSRYPNRVFRDVGSLEPGVEWHEAIERVLGSSDACLVVIGKDWLNITGSTGGRRLDDPRDTVRQEIVTALGRGMRVFPVLVGGAKMPAEEELPEELRALARRNALEITEQDWDQGFEKLADALDRTLGVHHKPPDKTRRNKTILVCAGAVVVAAVIIAIDVSNSRHTAPFRAANDEPTGASGTRNASLAKHQPAGSGSGASSTSSDSAGGQAADDSSEPPFIPPRARLPVNPAQLVGRWQGVVTGNGPTHEDEIDLYPDSSFRIFLNGVTMAVGRWRYDAAEDALTFLNTASLTKAGGRFSCKLTRSGESGSGFGGNCAASDLMSWSMALTRVAGLPRLMTYLPRLDISDLTLAEKQAFVESLGNPANRCSCNCGRVLLDCLTNDPTCNVSPQQASAQLASFLELAR